MAINLQHTAVVDACKRKEFFMYVTSQPMFRIRHPRHRTTQQNGQASQLGKPASREPRLKPRLARASRLYYKIALYNTHFIYSPVCARADTFCQRILPQIIADRINAAGCSVANVLADARYHPHVCAVLHRLVAALQHHSAPHLCVPPA